MKKPATIVLGDDHAIVLEGLRRILDRPEFKVIAVAMDGRSLLQTAADLQPDVVIIDIGMPRLNGIDAARELHRQNRKSKIVFLTMHSEVAYATAALAAGASAFVLKSGAGEELITAIRHALNGRTYVSKAIARAVEDARSMRSTRATPPRGVGDLLTHRQLEVLQLLAEGRQVKEIAALLKLAPKTVEFHKYRIMTLLGVHTVADLTRYAIRRGMLA
jgi:DNA-binding NarL/FixJ family response regulator